MRKELKNFAEKQEKKLADNDHKTHWSECDLFYLRGALLASYNRLSNGDLSFEEMQDECRDIANYSMMIDDNIERLK
jgi:hypothetical protein